MQQRFPVQPDIVPDPTRSTDARLPGVRTADVTGCPWHDVKSKLRDGDCGPRANAWRSAGCCSPRAIGISPRKCCTKEATRARVPVSLATVYNTLHQFTDVGLLRQVAVVS